MSTPTLHCRFAATLLVTWLVAALAGCGRDIPLNERAIPAELPAAEREAMRKLPFDDAHNFRDLGGYANSDGRTVKWGLLYRSDKLSDLSATDEQYLEKLRIRRIVDFRSAHERDGEPNRIAPDSSIAIVNKPIGVDAAAVDVIRERVVASDATVEEMGALLIDANRKMVENFTPVYREYMQELLHDKHYPTVFHCTAGKDRTGLAAALVLTALDVPRETIIEDYLASNRYTADRIDRMVTLIKIGSLFRANTEAVRALLGVEARYLEEAFAAMEEHYGSVDAYLESGLGIGPAERKQLQAILLE